MICIYIFRYLHSNQFKNIFTFGLACVTTDGYEPQNANDFQSGYAQLLLLTGDEVNQINTQIFTSN